MNLILDFGNTYRKSAVFFQKEIIYSTAKPKIELKDIIEIEKNYDIKNVILSSVVRDTEEIEDYLSKKYTFIKLSEKTNIPIKNAYQTPNTLGSDRLACAVAVYELFPYENVLILQLGTCLTSDFVTKEGIYIGGSISLGMEMRFNALNHFCGKLPLVEHQDIQFVIGKTTQEAILSGVINGIIAECNYLIDYYKTEYTPLKIILTGGNTKEFENTIKNFEDTIKNNIVAFGGLVLFGLNTILDYNVDCRIKAINNVKS